MTDFLYLLDTKEYDKFISDPTFITTEGFEYLYAGNLQQRVLTLEHSILALELSPIGILEDYGQNLFHFLYIPKEPDNLESTNIDLLSTNQSELKEIIQNLALGNPKHNILIFQHRSGFIDEEEVPCNCQSQQEHYHVVLVPKSVSNENEIEKLLNLNTFLEFLKLFIPSREFNYGVTTSQHSLPLDTAKFSGITAPGYLISYYDQQTRLFRESLFTIPSPDQVIWGGGVLRYYLEKSFFSKFVRWDNIALSLASQPDTLKQAIQHQLRTIEMIIESLHTPLP